MTCRDVIEFLNDYVDGELPRAQRMKFMVHLGVCRECRKYLSTYKKTIRASKLACADQNDIPRDIPEELVQAILKAKK
jgi:anti-sigma factor RsiW